MEQQIGMVGLGRMGGNMARRLARSGVAVVAWDRAAGARAAMATEERVRVTGTLAGLVDSLPAPRVVWLMLPAGAATEDTLG
jgi:6-phosphogluconate dehydrogenase